MLGIVTNNGFVIHTFNGKNQKLGNIYSENIIPRTEEAELFLDNNYSFKLMPGITDPSNVKGVSCYIKAPAYTYKKKELVDVDQWDLIHYEMEGYGIPCIITKAREVYPILRSAHLEEKWILFNKEAYSSTKDMKPKKKCKFCWDLWRNETSKILNQYWPVLEELGEETQMQKDNSSEQVINPLDDNLL
jgi:hypothetical protein